MKAHPRDTLLKIPSRHRNSLPCESVVVLRPDKVWLKYFRFTYLVGAFVYNGS